MIFDMQNERKAVANRMAKEVSRRTLKQTKSKKQNNLLTKFLEILRNPLRE